MSKTTSTEDTRLVSRPGDPLAHLAALELVSTALDRERHESDAWRKEAAALRRKLAEQERWEAGFRRIVTLLGCGSSTFEIDDVVERVRGLAIDASHESEGG
jgi:hypothetical protein